MLRFISRFLGFWLVAAALVAAVVDGAKSIAASSLVTTSLGETWAIVAGISGNEPLLSAIANLPWLVAAPINWLLAAPTVAVFGIIGVTLLVLGAKRRPPSLSREFAA